MQVERTRNGHTDRRVPKGKRYKERSRSRDIKHETADLGGAREHDTPAERRPAPRTMYAHEGFVKKLHNAKLRQLLHQNSGPAPLARQSAHTSSW